MYYEYHGTMYLNMNIIIRKAKDEDFHIIQSLNQALFQEEFDGGHDTCLQLSWPEEEKEVRYYRDALSKDEYVAYVAEHGDEAIGYLIGCMKNKYSYRTVHSCELDNMYVKKEWRRKGIGRRLVQAFMKQARKRGIERMFVSAYAKNNTAISFYTACGFFDRSTEMELEVS